MRKGKAMANAVEGTGGRGWRVLRLAGWSVAALLLLLPLVAMQFTAEVDWTGSDFVFAAVLIGGTGALFELTVRMSRNLFYRAGMGVALAAAFLTVWANGAVGMIGDEDNPYNLVFAGVLLIALLGAALGRFRAAGLAKATAAAALAQALAGAGGLAADPRGAVFSMGFAAFWLAAAASFARAARDRAR